MGLTLQTSENRLWVGREWPHSCGSSEGSILRDLFPLLGLLALGDLGVVRNSKEVEAEALSCPGLTSPRDGESTVGLAPLALSLWHVGGVLSLSPRAPPRTCPEEAKAEEAWVGSRDRDPEE